MKLCQAKKRVKQPDTKPCLGIIKNQKKEAENLKVTWTQPTTKQRLSNLDSALGEREKWTQQQRNEILFGFFRKAFAAINAKTWSRCMKKKR